jgi:N6-adenosine-specific RNA methylase IME4
MTTSWRAWLRIHPAAELFPLEPPETVRKWADDMKVRGQKLACTYIRDEAGPVLLDGRNRLDARELAGLRIDINDRAVFEQLSVNIDQIAYIVSLNINRRHLDESQRAMVAAKLATLRQGARTDLSPIGEKSQAQAAELLNVGKRSVERAREVQQQGDPDLVRAVETGKVSVSAAADIASLSREEQREILAKLNRREIVDAAKQIRAENLESRRAERIARIAAISNANAPLPQDRKFPVLLADPPWQFKVYDAESGLDSAADAHYPTMPVEEICALPVSELATDDAVLFLWTTAPHLMGEPRQVLDAWGFEYVTNVTWAKDRHGLGYWVRNQHEHLLIARRGNFPAPRPDDRPPSIISAPRREHSRKPDEAYALIERMYPELPKIELFARGEARPGWRVWGNEAPSADVGDGLDIPGFLLRPLPQEPAPPEGRR